MWHTFEETKIEIVFGVFYTFDFWCLAYQELCVQSVSALGQGSDSSCRRSVCEKVRAVS